MSEANVGHIREGVVKAGRRINDSRGNPGRTLCGAEITAYDITVREARGLRESDVWKVCQMCLARLPEGK